MNATYPWLPAFAQMNLIEWGLPTPKPMLTPTPRLVRDTPLASFASAAEGMLPEALTPVQRMVRSARLNVIPRPRRYPKGRGIRASQKRFQCAGGCVPASLGKTFHNLPWSYMITLDAPSVTVLQNYLDMWGGPSPYLDTLRDPGNPEPSPSDPFWIMTIASHEPVRSFDPRNPVGLHVHLLVGNVTWDELQARLSTWPGFISPNAIRKITHAFGAIHYVCSQDPWTGDPFTDKRLSRRHAATFVTDPGPTRAVVSCTGLFVPPIFSPNLDAYTARYLQESKRRKTNRRAQASLAGTASARSLTAAQRSARARRAARVRWGQS